MHQTLNDLLSELKEVNPRTLKLIGPPNTSPFLMAFNKNMLYEKDGSFISEFDRISFSVGIVFYEKVNHDQIFITFQSVNALKVFYNVMLYRKSVQKLIPNTHLGRQMRELIYLEKCHWDFLKDCLQEITHGVFHGWSPFELPQANQSGKVTVGEGWSDGDVCLEPWYIQIPLNKKHTCQLEQIALRLSFNDHGWLPPYLVIRFDKRDPWTRMEFSAPQTNLIQHRILDWCESRQFCNKNNWRILLNRKTFLEIHDTIALKYAPGNQRALRGGQSFPVTHLADLEDVKNQGADSYHIKKPTTGKPTAIRLYGLRFDGGVRLYGLLSGLGNAVSKEPFEYGVYQKTEIGWNFSEEWSTSKMVSPDFRREILSRLDYWDLLLK